MDKVTSQTDERVRSKPLVLIDVLWTWKWTFVLTALVVSVLFAPFGYSLYNSYFQATGVIRVASSEQVLFAQTGDGTTNLQSYIDTQIQRVPQANLIIEALRRLPGSLRQDFVAEDGTLIEAAEALESQVLVQQVKRSHLISVSINGKTPEGVTELVNNLMAVYVEKVDSEDRGAENRRLLFLEQEHRQLQAEVQTLSRRQRALAASSGATLLDAEANLYQWKWLELQKALVTAESSALTAKSQYEATLSRRDKMREVSVAPLVTAQVQNDPVVAQARSFTYERILEFKDQRAMMADENPDQNVIDMRSEGLISYLNSLEERSERTAQETTEEARDAELQTLVIEAETEYESRKKVVDEIKAEIEELNAHIEEHSKSYAESQEISVELAQKRATLQSLEDRIYKLKVEAQAPGRVFIDGKAQARGRNNMKKVAVLWLGVAVMAGIGFTLLRGFLDASIRTPADVASAVGAPPSWPISDYGTSREHPFCRVSLDDPMHPSAVAIRSLAIKLHKDMREHGSRIIAFSGVERGVGTSSVLLNCAHSLRQMVDRVLVIDLNRTAPRLHKLTLGDPVVNSLSEALRNPHEVWQHVYSDPERQIDCLFLPPEQTDIQRNQFVRFLETARHHYDLILIDAAPLMESDLTELAAVNSDIFCPVIQGGLTSYQNVVLSTDILLRLKVPAIAPVLNWHGTAQRPSGPVTVAANTEVEEEEVEVSSGSST